MKTAYGKLAALAFVLIIAVVLFAPMRSGMEDYLYARPRSIRMNRGDTYDITWRLDSVNPQPVAFASADESVAAVNSAGRVTAMGYGKTQIRLTARDGAKAAVQVEVAGAPASSLALNATSLAMEKGQVTGLKAVFDDAAEDTRVEWRSADERVAQVDAVGRVTAVGGGVTRVTAVTPGGLSASADVSVHVSGTAVHITPEDVTVGNGAQLRMDTYYLPEDTTDEIDRWSSSDRGILRVSNDGTMTAIGEGVAVLSVFSKEGLSGSTVIKVEKAADEFAVSPAAATIERGATLALEPRFLNAQGQVDEQSSAHYVTWASSDPEIATVENGVVTALRSGETRITAAADGKTAACNLRVQVLIHEITLNMSEVYLLREQTVDPIQLEASFEPRDPDDATITWSTNNDLVATVDENGLVQPVGGYGTAIITARAVSGAEARFAVNVVTQLPEETAEPESEPQAEADPDVEPEA